MSGTEGLGRVFFERKQKRIYVKALAALACFLGLPSLILLAYGIVAGELGWIVGGAVMLLLAALSALVAYDTHRSIFRCHERGVYRRSLLSESQLGYDEIREFTYQATQQYHNGIYIGTYLALVLTPDPRTDKRPLKFSTIIKKPDDSLDNLRDHIARLVAARMLERLAQGERVSWTPNLAFLTDGIEYRPASYLGRKEPRILPYEEVDAYEIRQGTFHLWDRSGGKPVIKEAVGTANFYPGYHVLISMGTRQPTADVATG